MERLSTGEVGAMEAVIRVEGMTTPIYSAAPRW